MQVTAEKPEPFADALQPKPAAFPRFRIHIPQIESAPIIYDFNNHLVVFTITNDLGFLNIGVLTVHTGIVTLAMVMPEFISSRRIR